MSDESVIRELEQGQQVTLWARICYRAADLVERGHCKETQAMSDQEDLFGNVMHPSATRFCLMGALKRAGMENGLGEKAMWAWYDKQKGFAAPWNNAPERTADEVAAKLREGAALDVRL